MSRGAGLVAATALVMLAGCTAGGNAESAPTPSAPAPGTSAASSPPAGSGTPTASAGDPSGTSTALVPGGDCLTGTWRLVRFVGLGQQSTYGTGQGGDVTVAFDNGRYTLKGRGERPYTVNLAGETALLTIDGTAEGTYRPDGTEMGFDITRVSGEGELQAGNQRRTLPMEGVAQVVAPRGKATLACPENVLLIALPTVRLELER